MKLTIIIPVNNKAASIEGGTLKYLGRYLRHDTEISIVSVSKGEPCIESETHALINAPEILALALAAEQNGADGVLIDCFDDPAVYACRECLRIPVFGGYTPSVLTALGLAERIGVITTDKDGILSEERKARLMGISDRIAAIRCVDMGVLGLMSHKHDLVTNLTKACMDLYHCDRVGSVCLGCTGMAYVIDDLRAELKKQRCAIAVVEPAAAAVTWLERTVLLGTSNTLGIGITPYTADSQ